MGDLAWIDEFVANIQPYVHVRREDRLLIKKPNLAYKLNPAAVEVLDFVLNKGGSLAEIVRVQNDSREVADDLNRFFHDLRLLLEGRLGDFHRSPAVERVPFALGYNSLPVVSEVAVTYRCNLRCRFCYAGCGGGCGPPRGNEMSFDEVQKVLTSIYREAQAPTVSFTGGEPLLRADLPEMIRFAKDLGFRVNLITNGTLVTQERVRALVDAGLDSAQVSLEGPSADVHDRITGVSGSFQRSVSGLKSLRAAGIIVHHHTTMNRLNWANLVQMPRLAASLKLDRLSMNLVIPTGSAEQNHDILIHYSEVGDRVLEIQRTARAQGVEFLWYSPTPLCLFNPIVHDLGNKGCAACDGLLSVAANGDLLPCSSFDRPLGNLLRTDFRTLWESEEARRFRSKHHAPEHCRECDRLAICNGACPLYWRVMGKSELDAIAQPAKKG
jgi:radical SAM protein with 4Fe4S-binding SPASM domain